MYEKSLERADKSYSKQTHFSSHVIKIQPYCEHLCPGLLLVLGIKLHLFKGTAWALNAQPKREVVDVEEF